MKTRQRILGSDSMTKTSGRLQEDFRMTQSTQKALKSIQRAPKEHSESKRAIRLCHTVGA